MAHYGINLSLINEDNELKDNRLMLDAIRIAKCESQFGRYKENWSGSSAYGLYQFMPSTFNNYCEGEITNDSDQLKCFLKLYEKHKSWWECL